MKAYGAKKKWSVSDEGVYNIGIVLRSKKLNDFEKMPIGFFIELVVE